MIRLRTAPPSRPDPRALSRDRLMTACWRGEMPAEALETADRERLIAWLWEEGWSDVQIATHTKCSTYTVARIRDRIGLPANSMTSERDAA